MKVFNWKCALLCLTTSTAATAAAEERILYCVEQHDLGLQLVEDNWRPAYSSEDSGRRYPIKFSDDYTTMSGVRGTDTVYTCGMYFPNKAPDVVTCINPLLVTFVFNYSTETERFLLTMASPGGWLGQGTERETGREPLPDHTIMGTCNEF
jgi:hypothetical protein